MTSLDRVSPKITWANNLNNNSENNILNKNLMTLYNRSRGDKYCVDKNGELKTMSFAQKLLYRFNSCYRNSIQNKVKNSINKVLQNLSHINPNDETNKKFITELFFEKLAPLNEQLFDRGEISKSNLEILYNSDRFRKQFEASLISCPQDKAQHNSYIKNFEEAQLMLQLGGKPGGSGGGFSDSYLLRGLKGNTLGIFKPGNGEPFSSEHPSLWMRARLRLLNAFDLTGSLSNTAGGIGYISEVAAQIIDRTLGTHLVCPTGTAQLTINSQKLTGSFQVFGNNTPRFANKTTATAAEYFDITKNHSPQGHKLKAIAEGFLNIEREYSSKLNALPQEMFEEFAILNYVTGELDRHAENYLIASKKAKNEKEQNEITNIIAIDNGMSMPTDHPRTKMELEKLHQWRFLPNAKNPFSKAGKERIHELYTKLPLLATQMGALYRDNLKKTNNLTAERKAEALKNIEKRIQRMTESVQVLFYCAHHTTMTMQEIANIRTETEVRTILDKYNKMIANIV